MKTKLKIGYLVASLLLVTQSAHAAPSQGTLAAESTGTSTITITTEERAQITNIADIGFGTYTGTSGSTTQSDDICIYSNDTAAKYQIKAYGDGASSAFTVDDGTTLNTIAYTVSAYSAAAGAGTEQALTAGGAYLPAGGFVGTNTYPCGTDNASYIVTMTHNNIMAVPANTYTGVLTLLVIPLP